VIGNHRADVVGPRNFVVELQHSAIPPSEIEEREEHYGRMIWLFDAAPFLERLRIISSAVTHDWHGYGPFSVFEFSWSHARKSHYQCTADVWWDVSRKWPDRVASITFHTMPHGCFTGTRTLVPNARSTGTMTLVPIDLFTQLYLSDRVHWDADGHRQRFYRLNFHGIRAERIIQNSTIDDSLRFLQTFGAHYSNRIWERTVYRDCSFSEWLFEIRAFDRTPKVINLVDAETRKSFDGGLKVWMYGYDYKLHKHAICAAKSPDVVTILVGRLGGKIFLWKATGDAQPDGEWKSGFSIATDALLTTFPSKFLKGPFWM
jgi:hypothetical protein